MGQTIPQEVPTGRRHIIERPRLTRLLDATSARVIMLVAPAGYGKTTLARQWLTRRPHAWYQATAASADVAAVALGILEAAATLLPNVGSRLREWLPTAHEPERDVAIISELLADDIPTWPEEAWFVIDDYHLLASEAAEELVRRIISSGRPRLLLTSRQRPSWVTARQLLYDEVREVGPASLAMNSDEANSVLTTEEGHWTRNLVTLANGWPAVIGLAALSRADRLLDDQDLPTALHDYFAEELYATLTPGTRQSLPQLALIPTITRMFAQNVLGASASEVLQEATRSGFFVPRGSAIIELHPLLRAFLLRKLQDLPPDEVTNAVSHVMAAVIGTRDWDGAFSIIARFERFDLLDDLLTASLHELTSLGRLATVRLWVEHARTAGFESRLLDLADAELAFREGLYTRSEKLASEAAGLLGPASPLTSSAFCRAGQSRYFMDDATAAFEYFRKARETARTDADARSALWGQFVAAVELEEPEAPDLLREYESLSTRTRDSEIRAANGRLMIAIRMGGIDQALVDVAPATPLVKHATDPIVRSSFWHVHAAALMLSTDYQRALDAVDSALEEIDSFHVEFARPHAYVNRIAAYIGLRRFDEADHVLNEMEELAAKRGDVYLLMNAMTLRCRSLLSRGLFADALAATSATWPRMPSLSQQAEFLATRAAAYACVGDTPRAIDVAQRSAQLSSQLEPRLLSQWVRVLVSLAVEESTSEDLVRAAFGTTVEAGALDAFVFAYRLNNRILSIVASDSRVHRRLQTILVRARDVALANTVGLNLVEPDYDDVGELTSREQDVYALVAEGKTNREIASALVISEATVKVHIRHILQKLQVRTRTEAAILAKRPLP